MENARNFSKSLKYVGQKREYNCLPEPQRKGNSLMMMENIMVGAGSKTDILVPSMNGYPFPHGSKLIHGAITPCRSYDNKNQFYSYWK